MELPFSSIFRLFFIISGVFIGGIIYMLNGVDSVLACNTPRAVLIVCIARKLKNPLSINNELFVISLSQSDGFIA